MNHSISSLTNVIFCPDPGMIQRPSKHGMDSVFLDAPTNYVNVNLFCEFLRTLATINGELTVRRLWVSCLRGGAHFWFYHKLSMAQRKYLVDAPLDVVIDALTTEFAQPNIGGQPQDASGPVLLPDRPRGRISSVPSPNMSPSMGPAMRPQMRHADTLSPGCSPRHSPRHSPMPSPMPSPRHSPIHSPRLVPQQLMGPPLGAIVYRNPPRAQNGHVEPVRLADKRQQQGQDTGDVPMPSSHKIAGSSYPTHQESVQPATQQEKGTAGRRKKQNTGSLEDQPMVDAPSKQTGRNTPLNRSPKTRARKVLLDRQVPAAGSLARPCRAAGVLKSSSSPYSPSTRSKRAK